MLKEKELSKLTEIAPAIHFHGAVSFEEIPSKYAQAAVCVFPSHMETQGLVAPEAMAMEKAVVFTKLGPGPETINDFETGLLCDPHSPEDISKKIIWAFSNKEKSTQIGKNARNFVLQKYSLQNIVQDNSTFFKTIILGNQDNTIIDNNANIL
jgi:glycosyltransferase involved in cell wall biosynthesis